MHATRYPKGVRRRMWKNLELSIYNFTKLKLKNKIFLPTFDIYCKAVNPLYLFAISGRRTVSSWPSRKQYILRPVSLLVFIPNAHLSYIGVRRKRTHSRPPALIGTQQHLQGSPTISVTCLEMIYDPFLGAWELQLGRPTGGMRKMRQILCTIQRPRTPRRRLDVRPGIGPLDSLTDTIAAAVWEENAVAMTKRRGAGENSEKLLTALEQTLEKIQSTTKKLGLHSGGKLLSSRLFFHS